jgi:hypothetical protein
VAHSLLPTGTPGLPSSDAMGRLKERPSNTSFPLLPLLLLLLLLAPAPLLLLLVVVVVLDPRVLLSPAPEAWASACRSSSSAASAAASTGAPEAPEALALVPLGVLLVAVGGGRTLMVTAARDQSVWYIVTPPYLQAVHTHHITCSRSLLEHCQSSSTQHGVQDGTNSL